MKPFTKKELERLEIKFTKHGFSIWIDEITKDYRRVKHWIVDAGYLFKNGKMVIGDYYRKNPQYHYKAVIDKKNSAIKFVRANKVVSQKLKKK